MVNLSLPGNPRYQPKPLVKHFGYDNLAGFIVMVETATLRTLAEIGVIPADDIALLTPELEEKLVKITTTEMDRVEKTDTPEFGKKTSHDIRALVRIMQSILPPPLRRWVHVPLTSYDALDTARSLQFVRAHYEIVQPLIVEVVKLFIAKIERYANTVQIGRTHGQHALPITVGFWLATILNRILMNTEYMSLFAELFVGKISGAVGACNAQVGLGISKLCGAETFEQRVLKKLGLLPASISTQILPPEYTAYYLFSATMLTAAFGQFGTDGRNLMRTEIGEISEPFDVGQVGSSTMAAKRNPFNLEGLVGAWLKTKNEFGKVFDTLISEHQRDLVGSSPARDFPTIIVNLVLQLSTLLRKGDDGKSFLERISVDEEACRRNLAIQGDFILAEPIYIALQMAGFKGDAHELVNHTAIPYATKHKVPLMVAVAAIAENDNVLAEILTRIPPEVTELLHKPESYVGCAAEKALAICENARDYLRDVADPTSDRR